MPIVDLVAHLGRWDTGPGPLYRKLARALRRALEAGHLAAGHALPAERRLAEALSVSRNTVAAAYAELREEGWIESRQGSATTVAIRHHSPVAAFKANGMFSTLLNDHPDVLDLTVAVPGPAPSVTQMLEGGGSIGDVLTTHGYHVAGYPPLREALADRLTDNGLPTISEQLMITSGAQQAIALAVQGSVRPGDGVVVEEVTYPGTLDALTTRGAAPIPVPVTAEGLDVGRFESIVRSKRPQLAYLIPTYHNPTGTVVRGPARQHLARVIGEHRISTIDDLTLWELGFVGDTPPPLAVLAPDAPIVSVGSLSKVFWGGLRIGWLRAHPTVVERLSGLKASMDLGTSAIVQAMGHELLVDHYEPTLAWRLDQLQSSLRSAMRSKARHLPDWGLVEPDGGPHLWMRLPDGGDAVAFSHRALRSGLAVVAGPLLAADDASGIDHVRLSLYRTPAVLDRAMRMMGDVWADQSAQLVG